MKTILTIILSFLITVVGYSQTRNVVVGTNDVIVSPTNFWNANASNGRSGLGLGTAATNPASAFQPSSATLSNLASSNGVNLTNIPISGVVGALSTNGNGFGLTNLNASNITGTLAIVSGGTGATNAASARTNLGLDWSALTNTNAATSLLGFTTNGQVIANTGTNVLTFTNDFVKINTISAYVGDLGVTADSVLFDATIEFTGTNVNQHIANTRTNLGLGWSALTNSNAGTGLVSVSTNGEVVSPTNFWQAAPITTTFIESQPNTNFTTNITPARFLHIHSLATNIVNVTNTIVLPTNTLTFEGDVAIVVHKGPTNSMTGVQRAGSTNNLITLTRFDEAVQFVYYNDVWQFDHNVAFVEPIYFSGTNAVANAAASRTNLGLGATWLTNTNVTNFRSAIGLGAADNVTFSGGTFNGQVTFNEDVFGSSSIELFIGTNGIQLSSSGISFLGTATATTRTNLGLGATWLTNTNVTNFRTAIGLGAANDVTLRSVNYDGELTINNNSILGWNAEIHFEEARFSYGAYGAVNIFDWGTSNKLIVGLPIEFANTTNAATTRTNLGLPLPALTNTNNANFQAAVFATNSNPTNAGNFNNHVAWMDVTIQTNGSNVSFRVPLYK
jgi:hypothetical protein